jgi:ankyrin repeat protein
MVVVLAGCGGPRSPQLQLVSAALEGDVTTIESLLGDPAVDINWITPKSGQNALIAAAGRNKIPAVQLLLRRGADPNVATDENQTALHAAAYAGYTDVVRLLIVAGANPNTAETRYGFTALAYAARNGHIDVMRVLLDAGANPSARIVDGRSPAQIAEQFGHVNAANVIYSYRAGP